MRYESWDICGFKRDTAVKLCREGLNPLVSVFLASRGFGTAEEAQEFICGVGQLYDPFLLKDMDKAVDVIFSAISSNKKIAVYGDYDVDGMTSCALLSLWLTANGADYEVYIPGRFDEGYGLNFSAIDSLNNRGVGLIITVDCGVTAIAESEYLKTLGMELVITDHHECKDILPQARAIVNPKRSDCSYPNKDLAGVGVVFKLICALESGADENTLLEKFSQLVAVGTIADVMSVVGENRELIKHGLNALNTNPVVGLKKLMQNGSNETIKADTVSIGFSLAPKLNAAGRMGMSELSVSLLLTEDEDKAAELAEQLTELNINRRRLEAEIHEEAETMLLRTFSDGSDGGPIILAKRGWYQGVAGIVAARMAEKYQKPAVIITVDNDGIGRGSCRSFGSFNIFEAVNSCADILENYGGHEMAAGITIAEKHIPELRRAVTEFYLNAVKNMPKPSLKLDFEVEKPELLTINNLEALDGLKPFGSGNLPPSLCIKDARLISAFAIGSGKHTKLRIQKKGIGFDAICFSLPPELLGVIEGDIVDIAFEPHINNFRGVSNVQLQVIDIRKS